VKASIFTSHIYGAERVCLDKKAEAKAVEIILIIAVGSLVKTPQKPARDSADIATMQGEGLWLTPAKPAGGDLGGLFVRDLSGYLGASNQAKGAAENRRAKDDPGTLGATCPLS